MTIFWFKQNRRVVDIDICNYMGYNELNGGVWMRIGEVSLLTNNVIELANFYKTLLETENMMVFIKQLYQKKRCSLCIMMDQ